MVAARPGGEEAGEAPRREAGLHGPCLRLSGDMEGEIYDLGAAGPQAELERAHAVSGKLPGGPPGARDRPGGCQRRGEMGPRDLEPAPERGARDRGRGRRLAAQEPGGGGGGLLGSHPPAASSSSSSESSPDPTSASTSSKVK